MTRTAPRWTYEIDAPAEVLTREVAADIYRAARDEYNRVVAACGLEYFIGFQGTAASFIPADSNPEQTTPTEWAHAAQDALADLLGSYVVSNTLNPDAEWQREQADIRAGITR